MAIDIDRAGPGRQNAMDWLTVRILECSREPMDDGVAEALAVYRGALAALRELDGQPETGTSQAAGGEKLSEAEAEAWVARMQNGDGSSGAHWSRQAADELMHKLGLSLDGVEWWAALNMMYSDYYTAAVDAGTNNPYFFASLAKAFFQDKDARPGKLARYFRGVV